MDVLTAFVADGEATELVEPGQGALDDPPMSPQGGPGFDAPARDADADVPAGERLPAAAQVVRLVGVEFGRALAPPAVRLANRGNGIEEGLEQHAVVAIGAAQPDGERNPGAVDHKMAFRARFRAIRWIRPGRWAPFLAGMLALSRQARLQSRRSASPSRSRSV